MIGALLKSQPLPVTVLGLSQPQSSEPSPQALQQEPGVSARLAVVLAGRFDLLHLIGLGGMATVYLARHRAHGALFAIKVLRQEFARDPGVLLRFRREALHAACLLGHPNIVSVLDVEEADGLHFLTMPYIRGEDLDHLLTRTGAFPAPEVLQAALQINSALEFAARKDLLHGDLTPGNIRLSEWGSYLVLDFGLSRALGGDPQSSANTHILGTPFYMAPEQIRGELPDIRTDLYSLGAILFELLTGRPPFIAGSLPELKRQHLEQAPALPANLHTEHPALAKLILRLLEKGPDARFSTPTELRTALIACGARSEAAGLLPDLTGQEECRLPRRRLESVAQSPLGSEDCA